MAHKYIKEITKLEKQKKLKLLRIEMEGICIIELRN